MSVRASRGVRWARTDSYRGVWVNDGTGDWIGLDWNRTTTTYLNGTEGADLVASRPQDPHDGSEEQDPIVPREYKHRSRHDHQQRPDEQDPPPSKSIRNQCEYIADECIAQQCQRQEGTYPVLLADCPEEDGGDEGDAAVRKHAEESGEEDEVDVAVTGAVEGVEAGLVDEPFQGCHDRNTKWGWWKAVYDVWSRHLVLTTTVQTAIDPE